MTVTAEDLLRRQLAGRLKVAQQNAGQSSPAVSVTPAMQGLSDEFQKSLTPPPQEPYVDWGSAPAGAVESDRKVGMTDAGEDVYETITGEQYTRPMVYPGGPRKAVSDVTMGDVGRGVANLATGIVGGIKSGITAPGRALAGEPVTNNDVMATAGLAISGIGAPKTATGNATKMALRDTGVQPSLGMRGKTAAMVAGGFEKFIPSAHVIANDAARAIAQIQKSFGGAIDKIGKAMGPEAAGSAMQKSLRGFVSNFKEKSTQLYAKVDKAIPQDKAFPLPNFVGAINEAKSAFGSNPAMASKIGLNDWDVIAKEAGTNGAPWEALQSVRSAIGEALDGGLSGPLADQATGRLKKLYGALTKDMEAAAASVGDDALNTWKRANNYHRAGSARIDNELDSLIGKNAKEGPQGEKAFEAFSAMGKRDRSNADVVRMRRIKSSMDPKAWGDVSASIVERLGQAKPGAQTATGDAFSPTTFLSEWNKLTPEAKRMLVPEAARSQLEKLAVVSERVRWANAERNFSGTGTPAGLLATGAAAASDIGLTIVALGGTYLTAKAMTSPAVLRILNAAKKGTITAAKAEAAISAITSDRNEGK